MNFKNLFDQQQIISEAKASPNTMSVGELGEKGASLKTAAAYAGLTPEEFKADKKLMAAYSQGAAKVAIAVENKLLQHVMVTNNWRAQLAWLTHMAGWTKVTTHEITAGLTLEAIIANSRRIEEKHFDPSSNRETLATGGVDEQKHIGAGNKGD